MFSWGFQRRPGRDGTLTDARLLLNSPVSQLSMCCCGAGSPRGSGHHVGLSRGLPSIQRMATRSNILGAALESLSVRRQAKTDFGVIVSVQHVVHLNVKLDLTKVNVILEEMTALGKTTDTQKLWKSRWNKKERTGLGVTTSRPPCPSRPFSFLLSVANTALRPGLSTPGFLTQLHPTSPSAPQGAVKSKTGLCHCSACSLTAKALLTCTAPRLLPPRAQCAVPVLRPHCHSSLRPAPPAAFGTPPAQTPAPPTPSTSPPLCPSTCLPPGRTVREHLSA